MFPTGLQIIRSRDPIATGNFKVIDVSDGSVLYDKNVTGRACTSKTDKEALVEKVKALYGKNG